MTYQEFQQELQKKGTSRVYQSLETVREAIRQCSSKEQERMKTWSENLDRLTTATEGEFDAVREGVFQGMNDMIADFRAPGELFSRKETREAMERVFDALDLGKRQFDVPRFNEAVGEKARDAIRQNTLNYTAQMLAYLKLGEEASPAAMFKAMADIPLWKRDRALRNMSEEWLEVQPLLDGDTGSFTKSLIAEQKNVKEQTRTFKEYSDVIAKKYREKEIGYAELEMQMKALRALAAEAVGGEQDPVKRSKMQDRTKIYMPDFTAKLVQLEQEAGRQRSVTEEENYQKKLAENSSPDLAEWVLRIEEVYGAKPVFHPEFANEKNKGYDQENFDKHLPEVDTKPFVLGGAPVSNEEFASLASLAVYDPAISCHAAAGTGFIRIEPNENLSVHFHSHRVNNFGNGGNMEIDGKSVRTVDIRAGKLIAAEVGPARAKVSNALEAYRNGDKAPLAQIIAYGIKCQTELARHQAATRKSDPRFTADEASPVRHTINSDNYVSEEMMKGTLALLERDKDLEQAVRTAGLTVEQQDKAVGMQRSHQVYLAGEAALEKLLEAARGGEQLSDFEKEQCALAVQRRNVLVQSLQDHMIAGENDKRIKEIDKELEDKMKELDKKYGEDRLGRPEAAAEQQIAEAVRGRKILEITKTPPVYQRLGESGVYALDEMAVEYRLGKSKAELMDFNEKLNAVIDDRNRLRKLSAFELAAELGITAPQTAKTTAQDIYDDLTKDYKAGKMNYTLYEARLRTMRELTGGNKKVKIDLKSIDDAIEYKLNKSAEQRSPMEKAIAQMTGPKADYEGPLGARLRGIYDVYGLTPKVSQASLNSKAYSQAQFDQLKDFQAKPGETHLKLRKFAPPLSNDDFAALAVAATQAYPEIGGVFFVKDKKTGEIINAYDHPTADDAIASRAVYVTDAYRDDKGARAAFGHYLTAVTVPAREKVDEVLREFNSSGSPAELGKLLGSGLHHMVDSYLLLAESQDVLGDNALEGAICGRLADIIEVNDDLKKEALKYTTKEELETAKGFKTVYEFTRAARDATQKLRKSVEDNTPLPETERRACIELMLRQKAMVISAKRQAAERLTEEELNKVNKEYAEMDKTTSAKDTIASQKLFSAMNRIVGLPDYVRMLGVKGPDFAREMLDKAMPMREAFFEKSDAEILKAMDAKIGSKDDPFQNKEYTKEIYQEERELSRSLHAARQKSGPQTGLGL